MKLLYLVNVLSFLALGLAAVAIFLRVRKEAVAEPSRSTSAPLGSVVTRRQLKGKS